MKCQCNAKKCCCVANIKAISITTNYNPLDREKLVEMATLPVYCETNHKPNFSLGCSRLDVVGKVIENKSTKEKMFELLIP
jgi:hypothetical protein